MKSFYTVSLSQILLRSPHKNYLGFIRAYYKKKFEKLFILPKEKALAKQDRMVNSNSQQHICKLDLRDVHQI